MHLEKVVWGFKKPIGKKVEMENFKEVKDVSSLTLMLTAQCQFYCRYCALDRSLPDMSEEILFSSIDLLFTSSAQEVELQFFGGEPLLRFDLIEKAIAYAEKIKEDKAKRVKYLLTTNGLLINDAQLAYLSKFDTTIMFSIDGIKSVQLKNRVLSGRDYFSCIIENLRKVVSRNISYFVNMVFLPEDIDFIPEGVLFLAKQGVRQIQISYAIGADYKEKDIDFFIDKLRFLKKTIKKEVRIRNFIFCDEPVLTSGQVNIDTQGRIYTGCSLVLEKKLPTFNKLFYVGNLEDVKNISFLKKSRDQQFSLLKKAPQSIKSSLNFGMRLYQFFQEEIRKDIGSVDSLVFMCTYDCQLACDYCAVDCKPANMSLDTLKKGIDFLLTTKKDQVLVRFWGGEPLIVWDLIKKGVSYGKRRACETGKQIRFMITTNGLLLDEGKLKFINKHPIEIMFSLDGDQVINKKHRFTKAKKDVTSVLIGKLEGLVNSGIPYFVNMVVAPDTVTYLCESLLFIKGLGVEKIQLCYSCGTIWKQKDKQELIKQLEKFYVFCQDKDILMNKFNECEPTMLSQELLIDIDAKLYYDAALFLEKKFPNLRSKYFMGQVGRVVCIDDLYQSKDSLYNLFSSACTGQQKAVLDNNIKIGLDLERFFNDFFKKTCHFSENSFLIPFMKSSLKKQQEVFRPLGITSVFMYIEGPCANDCLFCKHKNESYSEVFRVDFGLRENIHLKAKKLCFVGNDPLFHPNILKFIELAKKYNFDQIEVMTSGEKLADLSFCRSLIKSGVTQFSLPIFSLREKVHDLIVSQQGSLQRTILGIENILRCRAKIFVHSNLLKQNIKEIKDLERYMGKRSIPFVVLPVRFKEAKLNFEEVVPSYEKMLDELKNINSLVGFPLCVVKKIQKIMVLPADNISDSNKLYLLTQKFSKAHFCKQCDCFSRCLGFFRKYAQVYGLGSLAPLKIK